MQLENLNDVEDNESVSFIATTDYNDLENTTRMLAEKKYSYVIVSGGKKPKEIKGWKSIIQKQFDDTTCLTLMKKVGVTFVFFFSIFTCIENKYCKHRKKYRTEMVYL